MGRCKPLGLLNSFLSYALQYLWPILFPYSPCFLHFPSSSAVTMGGGSTLWIIVLGALIHTWRQEIGDGCGISCLLIWQEIFSFHRANLSGCLWLTVLLMSMFGLIQGPSCCVHLLVKVYSSAKISGRFAGHFIG